MIIRIDNEGNMTIDGEGAYTFEENPGIKLIGDKNLKHGLTVTQFNFFPMKGRKKFIADHIKTEAIIAGGAGIYIKQTVTVTKREESK